MVSCALALCAPQILAAQDAAGDVVKLPSGLSVQLHEVIEGPEEVRLRYFSPAFDPLDTDPEALLADMMFLCQADGLSRAALTDGAPLIVVSIADRMAEFGLLNTDVRQSFEAFSILGGTCIWEAF